MISTAPLIDTSLEGLTLHRRGKVRDVYEIGDDLMIVATDRISAFDYVLGSGIPDKGKVLTQLSAFWFDWIGGLVPHHMISWDVDAFPAPARRHADLLRGRSMLVRRTNPVQVECVARGYLSGSGWKEYQQTGSVCGIKLPAGLRESDRLPEPIFTPATKAETGHDINISEEEAGRITSPELISRLKSLTLDIYSRAVKHAEARGIIIADTKFEFGLARRSDEGAEAARSEVAAIATRTSCSSTKCSRPTRRASGRRISTSPDTASPASTSSTCATTSKRSSGTSSRRCRRFPTPSCDARVRSTSKPIA